ncbi:class Ib ribonucleoside-diphosphate reductase assembly flavoprotein NrdI [Thioclava sp. GXIMD4216]|uniref:class Ib ribonucleoside-diphosphate reductase assembly flavoprotein NrdI n=1 Tax=unclassified Thioclava TaxID=2621713 RepID=UPI0030D0FF45
MTGLAYFSSATGNTHRFITRLGLPAIRIGGTEDRSASLAELPFVLICPSYSDGEGRGAVPKPVIHALNNPEIRKNIRGVIGTGNTNFGIYYGYAGKVIAEKCKIPLLYRFELSGTDLDIARVRDGLEKFWRAQCLTKQTP